MVLRPKGVEPQAEAPDVEFVEELVRKSLSINAGLRNGESTKAFLEQMRIEAADKSRARQGESSSAGSPAMNKDRPRAPTRDPNKIDASGIDFERKQRTLSAFVARMQDDFALKQTEVENRRRRLEAEADVMRQQTVEELTDMMLLVCDGEDLQQFRQILKKYAPFLSQLGVRDVDVLKLVRRRQPR